VAMARAHSRSAERGAGNRSLAPHRRCVPALRTPNQIHYDPIYSLTAPSVAVAAHSTRSEEGELQFEAGISYRDAGLLKEKTRSLTQRELADHIYNYAPPVYLWELPEDLAALDESQVGIELILQEQQMLFFVLVPSKMVTNGEQCITRLLVDTHEIHDISLFD
jgi:hypothetical protein